MSKGINNFYSLENKNSWKNNIPFFQNRINQFNSSKVRPYFKSQNRVYPLQRRIKNHNNLNHQECGIKSQKIEYEPNRNYKINKGNFRFPGSKVNLIRVSNISFFLIK